jgi:hypothetical protein
MNSYAPRISLPYDEVKLAMDKWASEAEQVIVFQHDADATVKTTHCHILIIGSKVKEEALKRRFKESYPGLDTTGNQFWKWKTDRVPDLSFITYMSKGKLRSKYSKNISGDIEEEFRLKWSEPTTGTFSTPTNKYDEYEEIKKSFRKTHNLDLQLGEQTPILLDNVRKWTMSWYYKRDGRLPPASAYKRNAGSLFIWANEQRCGTIPDWCWEEIKNLWY